MSSLLYSDKFLRHCKYLLVTFILTTEITEPKTYVELNTLTAKSDHTDPQNNWLAYVAWIDFAEKSGIRMTHLQIYNIWSKNILF